MAIVDTNSISRCVSINQDENQICIVKKMPLTRNLYDDVDMILWRLRWEHSANFHCWAELGFVELRDLRSFLVCGWNLHFPEAEVVGREVVKCGLSLFLDNFLEHTDRFFSVYFHRKGFCVWITVDEAEESNRRHCVLG
jgi:hypothetical protein